MEVTLINLIVVAVLFLAFISFGIVYIIKLKLGRRGELSHSLNLTLIKVQLPLQTELPGEKISSAEIQEKISLMEQVLAQFSLIKEGRWHTWWYGQPFFALEMAVPHVGQELLFFCAVPRRLVVQVEKIITGVYPQAKLDQVPDYTIFYPQGCAAGAVATAKSKFLPFKTYRSLAGNPLGTILNAFSKVANEGEGLALQLVLTKAPSLWNNRLLAVVNQLRQGVALDKAVSEAGRGQVSKFLKTKKVTPPAGEVITVNESVTGAIEEKARQPLFIANIRLMASATLVERAEALIGGLAAPLGQFTNEQLNIFSVKKAVKRALAKLIYQFSFRFPDNWTSVVLSSSELASLMHFPNTSMGMPHVAAVRAKGAAVPLNIPKAGLLLGINSFREVETQVYMAPQDRARHLYIIGQTGTGKSTLLRNLIQQDIEQGKGVCFIDPHGDSVEAILEHVPASRVQDVIYFNPGDVERPMGLNMLEYDQKFPEQKTFITNELLAIFNKLYDMKTVGGPMFEQYFRNATALVMDDPSSGNTLLEINRVFVDKNFRDQKLSRTANPLLISFWKDMAEKAGGEASLQNIVPYISSKFDSFLSNEIMRPIVAQEKSAFRLREVMDSGKILLINLSKGRLGEINSALIGLIMVGKILMAAFSRVDTPEDERQDFYLYIDEFQNVTTDSIESILSEARKYRLNLIMAHQFIGQLTDSIKKSIFGNVGSIASFRIGSEDAEFLEKQFAPYLAAGDLMNIDNFKAYVKMLINGQTAAPFSLNILPPLPGSTEAALAAKDYSRNTYGRARAEVEAEVMNKFRSLSRQDLVNQPVTLK